MRYLLIPAVILTFTSCDAFFGTREPEPPDNSDGRSLWQQPTSPDLVLANMRNAFAERNVENYVRCLTDTAGSGRRFVFEPDQEVYVSNTGAFADWGVDEERQYITLMFSGSALPQNALSSLTFEHFTDPTVPADTAVYEEIYELTLEHTLENIPTRMRGIATFHMARDPDGNWSIYRWKDLTYGSTDDTLSTWSEMKARAL